jgi:ATP-dependent helicase/DNAse subunit B
MLVKAVSGETGRVYEEFYDDLVESYRADPTGTYAIVPTRHVARALCKSLGKIYSTEKAPNIQTIEDFSKTLFSEFNHDQASIGRLEAETILRSMIESEKDQLALFYDVDRMRDEFIPSIYSFITTLMQFKVEYPACLNEFQSEKSYQLSHILRLYRSTMQEKDLMDPPMIVDWATQMFKEEKGPQINKLLILGIDEPNPLELDLLHALCQYSTHSTWYNFAGQDWRPHGNEEREQAGSFDHIVPDEQEAFLSNALDDMRGGHLDRPIFISSFGDPLEEANAIASQISKLIQDGVDPQTICILLPQRTKSAPLFQQVLKDYHITAHISQRGSLAELPIVQTLFDAFEAVRCEYSTESLVRFLRSPYVKLQFQDGDGNEKRLYAHDLRRYATEGGIVKWRDDWEKALFNLAGQKKERKMDPLSTGSDIEKLDQQLGKIRDLSISIPRLIDLLASLEGRKSVKGHVHAVRALISNLRINKHLYHRDDSIRKMEFAGLRGLQSILDSMELFASIYEEGEIELNQFVWRLRGEILSNEISSFDSKDPAIEVLGMREMVTYPMNYTFIAGLVDGDMPDLNVSFPLADEFERSLMSILKPEELLRQERAYFLSALIHAKNGIYLSYHRFDDGSPKIASIFYDRISRNVHHERFPECKTSPSTLWTQKEIGRKIGDLQTKEAIANLETELGVQDIYDAIEIESKHRTGQYHTTYDGVLSSEKDIIAKTTDLHLDKTFSFGMLERYNECPFKYFVRDILHIKPFEDLEEGVSPTVRGSIFHNIARRFYSEWGGKVIPSDSRIAVGRIRQIGEEVLDEKMGSGAIWDAVRIQFLGRGDKPGILAKFIENETRDPLPGFTPMMFEIGTVMPEKGVTMISKPGPVILDVEGGPMSQMKFDCIIDRVDLGEGMKAFILDYKTGRVLPTAKAVSDGEKLQLPLYILALEEMFPDITCVGAGYYAIGSEMGIVPMLADKESKDLMGEIGTKRCVNDHYRQILEDIRKKLGHILSGMMNGEYHPSSTGKGCGTTCDYYTICRFNELRLLSRGGI